MKTNNMFSAIKDGLRDFKCNDDGSISAGFKFEKDSLVFAGHFPGNPILPGICQLEAVRLLLEKASDGRCQKLDTVKSAKFFRPVTCGEHAEFHISYMAQSEDLSKVKVKVKVSCGDNKISEFKITYITK